MFNCFNNCRICNWTIISDSVSVTTIDGVDTLVIDIPAGSYYNGFRYCIIIAQSIPDDATINMPVAISIGGDTSVVYPFTNINGLQLTASSVNTRTRYPVVVITNATTGIFRSLRPIWCAFDNPRLSSIPVVEALSASNSPDTANSTPNTTSPNTSVNTAKKTAITASAAK